MIFMLLLVVIQLLAVVLALCSIHDQLKRLADAAERCRE